MNVYTLRGYSLLLCTSCTNELCTCCTRTWSMMRPMFLSLRISIIQGFSFSFLFYMRRISSVIFISPSLLLENVFFQKRQKRQNSAEQKKLCIYNFHLLSFSGSEIKCFGLKALGLFETNNNKTFSFSAAFYFISLSLLTLSLSLSNTQLHFCSYFCF